MTKYGFQVKLDHKFPEKWDGNIVPALNQVWELVPLGLRYLVWYVGMWFKGKKPFIDQLKPVTGKQIYGVPLGGIGAGTIGRGFCGQFTRFQMRPSLYEHTTAAADQFIVTVHGTGGAGASAGAGHAGDGAGAGAGDGARAEYCQVLSACGPPTGGQLSGWRWSFPGAEAEYRGLYPRAWTDYHLPGQQLNLTCRQISPVLPHNYKDTSLPCAVFVWDVENTGDEEKVVSITFTFENGTGRKHSSVNCSVSSLDAEKTSSSGGVSGLLIDQEIGGAPCQYVVAARTTDERVKVSKSTFSPSGDGLDLWNQLSGDGSLTLNLEHQKTSEAGVAVSARVTVPGGGRRSVEMALAWHMPEIRFRSGGEPTTRYYSRWFPAGRQGAEKLCQYALDNYRLWEEAIEAWQQPVLNDPELPDWYKSAIFNELYFISDGGSLWLEMPDASKLPDSDPRREYGRFGYLESHEYIMYNTYDVHFYSSPALVHLWPQLQLSLQYDMADYITQEDPERRKMLYTGQMVMRKVANTVPHDVGNPGTPDEMPFVKLNSYQIHDVSAWKDLNLKFVLQVFRDHRAVGSAAGGYLSAMWPACRAVMTTARAWDTDGDGMIENSGAPDQTYDTWVMHGVSAYCGGLWIAALYAMSQMARELGDEPAAAEYGDLLARAQKVYVEKLWTVNSAGSYYKFDTSPGDNGGCIMADQLCGHWYLRSAGVTDEVFSRTEEALRTVYENNVLLFNGGRQGAVNGMLPDGRRNTYTLQSEETWTGVTYALAAAMVHEGMIKEGLHTAEGIYRTVYERIGQGYETPEALYPDKHYRAVGYMRPLSIWAIQRAWEQRRRNTAT